MTNSQTEIFSAYVLS